jgi:SWI/SNF-related matrix-associated actin-dependent regulator of chromatin subfamily A3
LDLIEHYLRTGDLDSRQFQRIDGECPTAKREKILEDFARDQNLRILIMTTGTGAVGYVTRIISKATLIVEQIEPRHGQSRIPC